jgi:glyoxylase-like metal-dependent hydrolase (beta-lactamase superfamily II)
MGTIGFRQLFDYDTWTYTYLLWDQDTKEAVIIDPVREQYLRDLEAVTDLQLKLLYALDTHVHADHVTALGMFRDSMGAQTAVGKPAGVGCADILLEDGQELHFGKHTLKALATPGHTDACTSYQVENMVFTWRRYLDSWMWSGRIFNKEVRKTSIGAFTKRSSQCRMKP